VTVFGAQALRRTSAASRTLISPAEAVAEAERIDTILAQTIEKPARDVSDNRDFGVARLVEHDLGVAIDPGDALAIGRAIGIEGQRHADYIEREARGDRLHQLINPLP